jgi:hypothetical protein
MVFRSTGYNYPGSSTESEHRRRHLEAISILARKDDAAAALERALAGLDEDIARGVEDAERAEAVRGRKHTRTRKRR